MALTDQLVNKLTWKIPNALALIGSRSGEERNGMTASWISQLSMEPVLIGVSVENTAVTHRLISEGGSFTVNLWDAEQNQGVREVLQAGRLRRRHAERAAGAGGHHRSPRLRRGDRLAGLRRCVTLWTSARTPCSWASWWTAPSKTTIPGPPP